MRAQKDKEIRVFSLAFLDVLANTIGGLAFLLILAIIMIGSIVFSPPVINTEELQDAFHGADYVVWLSARDGLGKFNWLLGEGELPRGLSLDSQTGKLHGKPLLPDDAGPRGAFEFEVVCESQGESDEKATKEDRRQYRLTVHRERPATLSPVRIVTTSPLPTAYVSQPYPLAFAAEGGGASYSWRITGSPPAGMRLTDQGQLSGRPASEGSYEFSVRVDTAEGFHDEKKFTLDVATKYPPPPPTIPLKVLTEEIPEAIADRAYTLCPAAQGGTPPYAWSFAGNRPAWFATTAERASFAGTPGIGDIGEHSVTWEVRDRKGETARSKPLKLRVMPPTGQEPPPLEIKTTSLPDGRMGKEYDVAVAVRGGYPPYEWETSGSFEALGITFNADDGRFAGRPSAAGRAQAVLNVRDRYGSSRRIEYRFSVHPQTQPLRILTEDAPAARVGRDYSLVLSATGGYSPYKWYLAGGTLPPAVELATDAGRLQGRPVEAGSWRVELGASDSTDQRAPETVSLELNVLTAKGFYKLEIVTDSLPDFIAGSDNAVALACEGGEPPYSWRATAALPAGLEIRGNRLAGAPTTEGEHIISLALSDASGASATAELPLRVRSVVDWWLALLLGVLLAVAALCAALLLFLWLRNRAARLPLRILTAAVPNARASCEYSVQLACQGGRPPYRWSIVGGETIPGIELSNDGRLSGVPFEGISVDETKELRFTVRVEDSRGGTAEQEI